MLIALVADSDMFKKVLYILHYTQCIALYLTGEQLVSST